MIDLNAVETGLPMQVEPWLELSLPPNIIKYLWRYRYKNGVQDLEKAQWYLNKLIEVKKGSKNSTDVFTSFGIELDNGC